MATALMPKHEFTSTNDHELYRVKMERVPQHVDPRMLDALRDYATARDPLIVADDIVLFLPHTRRGSSATTPYGFLWVKSLTACDFFLTQAVDFKVRNVAIIFKVPERISLFPFPLTLYPSLFPSFDSS
jgi:hypothetical protein